MIWRQRGHSTLRKWSEFQEYKKSLTQAGLEPTISCSVGRRLIHWATEPWNHSLVDSDLFYSELYSEGQWSFIRGGHLRSSREEINYRLWPDGFKTDLSFFVLRFIGFELVEFIESDDACRIESISVWGSKSKVTRLLLFQFSS